MELYKTLDKMIKKTISDGLKYDKELTKGLPKDKVMEIETDYMAYGTLFAVNFVENLRRYLDKNEDKFSK